SPEVRRDGVNEPHELTVVAHAGRQAMCDDDLRGAVHSGLCVPALDIAVLGQQQAALRVGEVALRLAIGLRARRLGCKAVLLTAFRDALLLGLCPAPPLLLRSRLRLSLQLGLRGADL